jgi:hypothetical protein
LIKTLMKVIWETVTWGVTTAAVLGLGVASLDSFRDPTDSGIYLSL